MASGDDAVLRVGITVDPPDWHSEALTQALAAAGAQAVPFKLAAAGFDTRAPSGLRIPGFGTALPDAVIVRAISGGTFEAVTMRLGVLHALGALGVPVWNEARTIERCVDKSTTSFLMAGAGIPTPPTWTVESLAEAEAIVRRETRHGPLVFKPLFGAQGRGLRLIASARDLPDAAEAHGVYYLQRFVGVENNGFRDTRVLVCRGRVAAAMVRHAESWITNIKQGGQPRPVALDAGTIELALRCAALVDAAFVGVDIVRDRDGAAWVIEINSMPAWRGLQEVTPFPIAATIAHALLEEVRGRRRAERNKADLPVPQPLPPAEGKRSAGQCSTLLLQQCPSPGIRRHANGAARDGFGSAIAEAFAAACRDELEAPKPGNVHVFADGHGWSVADFITSAEAAADAVARSGARVGERILAAVEATQKAVSHNTNLGIILLCAPLAAAAEHACTDLRGALHEVLASLDIEDARAAFRAIALAAPGGLGRAPRHDVLAPATVDLRQAMSEAAGRDRIAFQYQSGFADVFDVGLAALAAGQRRWKNPAMATLSVFLAFLARCPDSHIARKHGLEAAEEVRCTAMPWIARLNDAGALEEVLDGLLRFDADLKRRGLNPGTTADLTVATMFTYRLTNILSQPVKNA